MFGKSVKIDVYARDDGSVIWEYDISRAKKLEYFEGQGASAVLIADDGKTKSHIRAGKVKFEKDKRYRLFGVRKDLSEIFEREDEFRIVSKDKQVEWDGRVFTADVIAIGTVAFSTGIAFETVKAFYEELTPEKPLTAIGLRKVFFRELGNKIEEELFKGAAAIKYPCEKPTLSGEYNEKAYCTITWKIDKIELSGEEYEKVLAEREEIESTRQTIDRNTRRAQIIKSETEILEETKKATRTAKDIENIKEED